MMKTLQSHVIHFETDYYKNASINDSKIFSFGPIDNRNTFNGLETWLKSCLPSASFESLPSNHLPCISGKYVSHRILASLPEESLRKQVYLSSYAQPEENVEVLGNLIKSRQSLAKVLGYDNHCDKLLKNGHVIRSSEEVMNFLDNINESLQSKVDKEMKLLRDLKRRQISGKPCSSRLLVRFATGN